MDDKKELNELVEDAVNKGATTVEEIHREIANLPLSVLERAGLLEEATGKVRSLQDASIGAIYDTIRDVNSKVTTLASDLLKRRKS